MAHARLKRLKVQAFRSFVEPTTINFPDSGMILFRGFNLDSNGSSGSGKSSILLALSYVFGFCRFPATALQSWLTDEPMEVEVELATDRGQVVITRGQKLSVSIAGTKLTASNKQLEEKVTEILGLNPELLAALTYRGQKQPGLFLSKTDSEKKEFLTTLLDLGRFETAGEQSQAKAKALEVTVAADRQAVEAVELELAAFPVTAPVLKDEAGTRRDLELADATMVRISKQVDEIKAQLKVREDAISREAVRIRQRYADAITLLTQKVADLVAQNEDLEFTPDRTKYTELTESLEQAEVFLKQEQAVDGVRRDAQFAQLVKVEKELAGVRQYIGQGVGIPDKLKRINNDLLALARDLCPTCERTWDAALSNKRELEQQRDNLLKKQLEVEAQEPIREALETEVRALRNNNVASPVIAELEEIRRGLREDLAAEAARMAGEERLWLAELDKKTAEARAELDRSTARVAQEIELYRNNMAITLEGDQDILETLERELEMARAHKNGIQSMLSRLQIDNAREAERAEGQQARRQQLEKRVQNTRAKGAQAALDLNAELDFQKLIGREGFLGSIFDEVLWEISDETNRILGGFPNTAHVTLYFRSESSTQKGTIKKAIVPVVSIAGHEAPLASGCSGGMITAVELAVDMAVSTVVSRRTDSAPGWIVLDESFEGLGQVEKEACMEILSRTKDKLVLVVDHASEFKELFTEFVDVEYAAGRSRLKE